MKKKNKKVKRTREEKKKLREENRALKAERKAKKKAQKEAEKERKRVIKEANKMLIPATKKSKKSMGFVNFDPSGTFHFENGRWIRVYEVTWNISGAVKAALKTKSRLRITHIISPDEDGAVDEKSYVSLIAEGDIYKPVQEQFEEDEEIIQDLIGVKPLSVDEAVNVIIRQLNDEVKPFSHEAYVKSKKDLLKEISPLIEEERNNFSIDDSYGESLFFMEYPPAPSSDPFSVLKELNCKVFVSFDLVGISEADKEDYVRTLEKRYSRSLSRDAVCDFLNVSGQTSFICGSFEEMEETERRIKAAFREDHYLIAREFGDQSDSLLSQVTLGLLEHGNLRNVSVDTMDEILRRSYGDNKDKV